MKTIKNTILILCVLIFLGHSNLLSYMYPNAETDYAEFVRYYYAQDRINEILFCLLFLYAFLKSRSIRKGVACFGFVITFGSVVDKVFFNIFEYLYTDIFLLIFASVLGYLAYKRQ